MARLRIATCQFSVGGDLLANARAIRRQMREARARGAQLAHLSEACLSGYAGVDVPSLKGFDWDLHAEQVRHIMRLAGELKLWTVIGSSHRLSKGHKPHNSLYIIDASGRLVDRYDKRFCTESDLEHYTPGSAFTVFEVGGVRCGALICYDVRFPELYREYRRRGVQVMFHSFHQAHGKPVPPRENILGHITPASVFAHAANNYMWISANNSSARVSRWASFVAQPDGMLAAKLTLHRAGMIITTIDTTRQFYDAPGMNRERAMRGLLSSLPLVRDPRSVSRKTL